MTQRKLCRKCHEELPLSEFHRDTSRADGFANRCRSCCRKYQSQYYTANSEGLKKKMAEYRAANPERIDEAKRRWQRENPESRKVIQKRYYEAHKEEIQQKYAENKDAVMKRVREWVKANPDKRSAIVSRYAQLNKPVIQAKTARRRAQLKSVPGTHTAHDIQKQRDSQENRCFYCGIDLGDDYHVDHFLPLALGGSNDPENIVLACPSCNLRKGSKHPEEFMTGGPTEQGSE